RFLFSPLPIFHLSPASIYIGGSHLLVFKLYPTESAKVTTRFFPMIKTKGALAVSFTFFRTSFLFISSHFAAGDSKVKKRIQNYEKIIKDLQLPKKVPLTNPNCSHPDDVTSRFDEVFWFGDFNFRLSKSRTEMNSILENIPQNDVSSLLQYDQLSEEVNKGTLFRGFKEADIHFFPTYKFDIGSDVYDTSGKQRTPSYTDRVMYKSRHEDDILVLKYGSCARMKQSDHKPVFGVYKVWLRKHHSPDQCFGQENFSQETQPCIKNGTKVNRQDQHIWVYLDVVWWLVSFMIRTL
uniref:Inositol polyphosphate-related phosphatase domain-containing protein n=1 Tax=Xenopus tropicalis TaxID=8364 RepID=A0A803JNW7_XENTR